MAFQQYYGQDTVRLSPYDLTGTELIKIGKFYWDEKSRARKEEIEGLFYETFYAEKGTTGDKNALKTASNIKKSAIMVELGWKERLSDVIRHGIMLGYRGALWTIQMAGERDYTLNMISNILRTEYELGFTQMLEDRERTKKKR